MREPMPPKRGKYFNTLGMRAHRLRDLAYSHERNAFLLWQRDDVDDEKGEREARRGWIRTHRTLARLAKREAARIERLAAARSRR